MKRYFPTIYYTFPSIRVTKLPTRSSDQSEPGQLRHKVDASRSSSKTNHHITLCWNIGGAAGKASIIGPAVTQRQLRVSTKCRYIASGISNQQACQRCRKRTFPGQEVAVSEPALTWSDCSETTTGYLRANSTARKGTGALKEE